MKLDLSGRTALVTGSTAGIGFAAAAGLAAAGAAVVVNGRDQARVDAAVRRLGAAGGSAVPRGVAADLATAEGCASLVAAEPRCDILVCNAGIFPVSDFFDTPDETWERVWQVNVMSAMRLARAYLPGMQQAGWGRVIILGSESSFNIPPDMLHYGVSKAADVALARGLAKRMAGTGVTVNSVLPGPTLSDGVAAMLQKQADAAGQSLEEAGRDFVASKRPSSIIQRAASPEEVANMIVYLASPASSATTGASLRVDGGIVDVP